jgi:hypothetical protein
MGKGLKYVKPCVFHIMGRTWTQHDVLREHLDIKGQEVTGQLIKLLNEDIQNL